MVSGRALAHNLCFATRDAWVALKLHRYSILINLFLVGEQPQRDLVRRKRVVAGIRSRRLMAAAYMGPPTVARFGAGHRVRLRA